MEARRGKVLATRTSATRRRSAAVGKENVCPESSIRATFSASRSPLPEGFPRAPLQDITDILSPVSNVRPKDGTDDDDSTDVANAGLRRHAKKRSKCVAEIHLRKYGDSEKCVALRVEDEPKAVDDSEKHRVSDAVGPSDLKDAEEPMNSAVEGIALPCGAMIATGRVLKSETEVAPSLRKPVSSAKHSSLPPATCLSSHALRAKPKMSSIMKFR